MENGSFHIVENGCSYAVKLTHPCWNILGWRKRTERWAFGAGVLQAEIVSSSLPIGMSFSRSGGVARARESSSPHLIGCQEIEGMMQQYGFCSRTIRIRHAPQRSPNRGRGESNAERRQG